MRSIQKQSAQDQAKTTASPAPRQNAGVSRVDNRPEAIAQRQLAAMMGNSPQALQQKALAQMASNSPRTTAQLKQLESAFGRSIQRQGAEEEELLQGKFDTAQRVGPDEDELMQGKFEAAQRVGPDEDELMQGKFDTAQRVGPDEDELMQGKFATAQRVGPDEDELMQGKFTTGANPAQRQAEPAASNRTGLPDSLKSGIENLSGLPMDDVRVHYNSSKPKQLQALAYTQGTNIHVGPGQEQHLPHEAWHVAQQKQGRVKPTLQMEGTPVNDDAGLEKEADVMGNKAMLA